MAIEKHVASTAVGGNGFPVCKSFPIQGQIRAIIESGREQKRTPEFTDDWKKDPKCQKCNDTGFERVIAKPNTVRRCSCRARKVGQ